MEGDQEGQTQCDLPTTEDAYFSHPIDIHLSTKTIQGWPRINIEVWHQDKYGRQEVYGYGTLFVPTSPGEHEVLLLYHPKFLLYIHISKFIFPD